MMWFAQTRVGSSREKVLKAWRPARVPPKPKPSRDMKTRAVSGAVLDLKRAGGVTSAHDGGSSHLAGWP
jgi:hypothetical protein